MQFHYSPITQAFRRHNHRENAAIEQEKNPRNIECGIKGEFKTEKEHTQENAREHRKLNYCNGQMTVAPPDNRTSPDPSVPPTPPENPETEDTSQKTLLSSAWSLIRHIGQEFSEDRVTALAAEIAYFGILSILPTLLLFTTTLHFLDEIFGNDVQQNVIAEIEKRVADIFGTENDIASTVTELFNMQQGNALTVALLVTLYSASRGFYAIIQALDMVYDLEETRSWIATRLLALVMSITSVLVFSLLLGMITIGPLLGHGEEISERFHFGKTFTIFWDYARLPFAFSMMVAWCATLFHVAPNHQSPWRSDLPGAILVGCLWIGLASGFGTYLSLSGGTNTIISGLGAGIAAMLFLYFTSIILLIGGELNAALWQQKTPLAATSTNSGPTASAQFWEKAKKALPNPLKNKKQPTPKAHNPETATPDTHTPDKAVPERTPPAAAPPSPSTKSTQTISHTKETQLHPDEQEPGKTQEHTDPNSEN